MNPRVLAPLAGRIDRVHRADDDRHAADGGQVELEALSTPQSRSLDDLDLRELVVPGADAVDRLGPELNATSEFPDLELCSHRNRANLSTVALTADTTGRDAVRARRRDQDRRPRRHRHRDPEGVHARGSGPASSIRRSRTEVTAYVGILSSVVSVALVLGSPWPWLALAGALVLACVPAGAAVMCWVDSGEDAAQAGLTLAVSLAVVAIASAVMIWTTSWQPQALFALAFAGAASCALRLRKGDLFAQSEQATPHLAPLATDRVRAWRIQPQLALPFLGMGAWAYGVSQIAVSKIGSYGLLASANVWFALGFVALVTGFVLELRRSESRGWLLALHLIGLIVATESTVSILFHAPEYAWVYKHVGIVSAFQKYGHITDPTSIYQQWPALFAAVAGVSSLAHVNALSFAGWGPLAFELADALLLLAIFRLLSDRRRVAWLAVLLYEGLACWVGQDYLSPQAFGYLLWLAMVLIILRWLRAPAGSAEPRGRLARLRAPLLAGLRPAPATTKAMRAVAITLVITIYFAIVAAHQLTPYAALAGVGALTALDLVRPRWLLVVMALIAGAYLAPHYDFIAKSFGGLFSGGNPLLNASGTTTAHHAGAEATTALIVRALAGCMWLASLAVIAWRRRTLGWVVIPAALAFSPFLILGAQSYGGEAIYRVFLFSAPWCALLIAGALCEIRVPLRWLLAGGVGLAVLFAGLQGLYGAVSVDAFTTREVTASRWLYGHIPHGSLIVLPQENFPTLESADYNDFDVQIMPADPQAGPSWMNEADLGQVKSWIAGLGHRTAYVVVSRSMAASTDYYGEPKGYAELVRSIPAGLRGSVVYRNDDATIYRLNLGGSGAGSPSSTQPHAIHN